MMLEDEYKNKSALKPDSLWNWHLIEEMKYREREEKFLKEMEPPECMRKDLDKINFFSVNHGIPPYPISILEWLLRW